MTHSSRFSLALLSLSLGALLVSCSEPEFKAGVKVGAITPAKAADATPSDPPNIELPETTPTPDITTDPIAATETVLDQVVAKIPDSIIQTFKAGDVGKDSFQFTLDLNAASTDFKLTDDNRKKVEQHNQITRTAVTDSFNQGSNGTAIKDTFVQNGKKGLVDILVVIDDSSSMNEEQNNLASKMSALLVSLADANWRIGVITTTVIQSNGVDKCNLTLIKSTDTDASAKFTKAVTAGTKGSGNEEGIRQAVNGLKCTENPWVRSDSTVAVLIVSDEDNCSLDGKDCPTSPGKNEAFLEDYVEKTLGRVIGKSAGFYAIFSPPANPCSTAGNKGILYQRLMEYKTGANASKKFGNICDADYSSTLNGISSDIALLLTSQFELTQVPDAGSLVLSVDNTTIAPSDFTLNSKTITFVVGREPANGKILTANYHVGATPLINKVTLKNDPVPETIAVKVGSTTLAASGFKVSGRDITFTTQPPELSTITVDYRIAAALTNTFVLESKPLGTSLSVLVNGKAATGMTFDAANNKVIINPAPTDGAVIEIHYDFLFGPTLAYHVATVQGAQNIRLFDGTKQLTYTSAGDLYTILAADHRTGATFTLKYDLPSDGSPRTFTLPHTPDANTVVMTKDVDGCKLNGGISVTGSSLEALCVLTAKSDFSLDYTYTEHFKAFTMNLPSPINGRFDVSVDGVATTDYTIAGNVITLNTFPAPEALVTVRYTLPE